MSMRDSLPVRVLAAGGRAGSKVIPDRREVSLLDNGAVLIAMTYPKLLGIARDAGIARELTPGGFVFGRAAGSTASTTTSRPATSSGRARCPAAASSQRRGSPPRCCGPVGPPCPGSRRPEPTDDTTVAEWSAGNVSPEIAENVVGALVRDVLVAEPEEVSRADFPGALSLFRGAKPVAFREGMGYYADQLASAWTSRSGPRC
jgi:oxygen-dependent protoporphyrinogen oxidase